MGSVSGRILIAGGCTNNGFGDATIRYTEIYNPTTGSFSVTRDSRGRQTMLTEEERRSRILIFRWCQFSEYTAFKHIEGRMFGDICCIAAFG